MLGYLASRAKQDEISFEVKLHPNFAAEFGQVLSELELSHLLSNLAENALSATRGAKKRTVQVHLGVLRTTLIVEVSDTGQEFDPAVYQSLGLSRHSTRTKSGGSGIGLMELWALKRNTRASLLITEYVPQTALYTKTISLIFDQKNHYLIQTYRPQTLLAMQTRGDLYVLPLD
jgi:sensor histidine kinase regulating citrate/malate metabolism